MSEQLCDKNGNPIPVDHETKLVISDYEHCKDCGATEHLSHRWCDSKEQRRERIATACLTGMLANSSGIDRVWKAAVELNSHDLEGAAIEAVEDHLVERAISMANRLISGLDKEK